MLNKRINIENNGTRKQSPDTIIEMFMRPKSEYTRFDFSLKPSCINSIIQYNIAYKLCNTIPDLSLSITYLPSSVDIFMVSYHKLL